SATLGIVLLWPAFRRRLRRLPRVLAEPLGLTLAVTVACLPVSLSAFQLVSLISPIAHVPAIPLLPLVLVSAGALAVVSPWPALATPAAWLAWMPTSLLAWIIHAAGSLPAAAISMGRLPPTAAACLAATLLAWGLWQQPEMAVCRVRWRRWGARHQALLTPVALI